MEYDFDYYEIYRAIRDYPNPATDFDSLTSISTRATTSFIDYDFSVGAGQDGAAYMIRTYDLRGHYSPFTDEVTTPGWYVNGGSTSGNYLIADEYHLLASPNPFNPSTNIEFSLPADCFVELAVFDIAGREIAALVNENLQAGDHSVKFEGKDLSSGIYLCRLKAGGDTEVRKILLIK